MITTNEDINKNLESTTSAITWPAIFGGTFVAIAVSLILLILGSSLGFSSLSPWSYLNPTAVSFTVGTVIWLIIMQWLSAGVGGYVTGRLRTKWTKIHNDEIFFRDTAHGFLVWSLSTIFVVIFTACTTFSLLGGALKVTTTLTTGAVAGASYGALQNAMNVGNTENESKNYYVDSLFRTTQSNTNVGQDVRQETTRILTRSIEEGNIPEGDKTYLANLVASRIGISPEEATQRIDDVMGRLNEAKAKVQESAEKARKTAIYLSLFTFLSMIAGAFIGCITAALGGKHRDEY
ncbi:MAG: hypothetical protein K1X44_05040 [Alphaproteobacteria bacterium]|nr:hypothetical protein [Alphaproteobacteria bacterium]